MSKVVKYYDNDSDDGYLSAHRPSNNVIDGQRAQLPMFRGRYEVVKEIFNNQVTVIVGETGSGKSTQLPQALLEFDDRQNIVVSQPRRVAAMSLGNRVAAEARCPVGGKVGYNVRFDAKISKNTKIRYVTDGMLLREFMLDPLLRKYTTVIVDEAHERTITSDLVLGLLKRLQEHRSPSKFRIVVMSATLNADQFCSFFGENHTAKLYVPGRAFKVDRYFLKAPVPNLVDAVVETVTQVNSSEPGGGDVLVFLPGQDEIESAADLLRNAKEPKGSPKLVVVPLYASLPEKEQQLAFAPLVNPQRQRKIILATNIAETSVTVPGVRYVIDSGMRKVRVHRSSLGLESLLPARVSQASATQRMGRAGREGHGKCWRLYTEAEYLNEMVAQTEPEISRVSLAFPILLLKRIGVEDVLNFPWVDPPKKVAIRNALLQLFSLKAVDTRGLITPFGLQMATLPLEPPLAAVLVSAQTDSSPKIREATLDVAACLSVQDLLITPSAARRQEVSERRQELFPASVQYGDLVLVKLIWDQYQEVSKSELKEWCWSIGVSPRALKKVVEVRKQLVGYLESNNSSDGLKEERNEGQEKGQVGHKKATMRGNSGILDDKERPRDESDEHDEEYSSKMETEDYELLIKSFLRGFVTNTALALPDRRFQTTMTQQAVSIHPGSALFGSNPEAIMYLEYVYTLRGYGRIVSPIEVEWLREIAPHLLARASRSIE